MEADVKSIEDNQLLLYSRAMHIWESIQRQAQARGDVTSDTESDPSSMFPIDRFSRILVDTPPLPVLATYELLVDDVAQVKRILQEQGKGESIERADADMVIGPSERTAMFGYPIKWRRLQRIADGEQLYP